MRHLVLTLFLFIMTMPALGAIDGPEALDLEEAAALLKGADDSDYEGADRLVLFDRMEVDVEETGLSHVYQHRFVKVVDFAGARAMRAFRFDYDPATNITEFRTVRIHRAEGGFEDVDLTLVVDATAPTHMIYWGGRMLVLPLPPLEPGDGVETITYKKGFQIAYLGGAEEDERYIPPMRGHFYDVIYFQEHLPMLEKRYTVHVPRDKPLQYSIYNDEVMSSLHFTDDSFIYEFWKEDVPAVVAEDRMIEEPDVVGKVVMATVADWQEKSRWFYNVNEERDIFGWTPEIEKKVNEITAGLKGDDAKIAALLHWVAQNIRYSGLNMGEGEGYTIHPSTMTYRDRCGVCKDIAGMLVTLLRVAGYPTFPAMTMAGSKVEAIPADQFNHCVVAMQKEDGGYLMLDPTWAPWNNPIWSRWEGEQNYVIGSPEGEGRMMIPAFGPEENLLTVRSRAKIDKDGNLRGTFRLVGKGITDGRLRGVRANNEKKRVRSYLEGWLGAIDPRVDLIDYSISDHRDFTIDTSLEITYEVTRFADLLGDDIVYYSPALLFVTENERLSRIASVPVSDDRKNGVFIWAAQKVEIDETIQLPSGYEAEEPEKLEKEEAKASALFEWKASGNKLILDAEYTLETRTIPIEDYKGLVETIRGLQESTHTELYATR